MQVTMCDTQGSSAAGRWAYICSTVVYHNGNSGWQQHSAAGYGAASGDTSWANRESQARSSGSDHFAGFRGGGGFGGRYGGGGFGGGRFGGRR
jgi:hypothetical protein